MNQAGYSVARVVRASGQTARDVRGPDVRAFVIAGVAAWAAVDPVHALRYGGLLAGVVVLVSLGSFRPRRAEYLAAALALLGMLSIYWSVDADLTWQATKSQFGALAIFLVVRLLAVKGRNLVVIGAGYLAGCLYTIYLLQRDNGTSVGTFTSGDRIGVTGLNFNYTSYALATGAAVIVLLWTASTSLVRRTILIVAFAAMCAGIYQTGTRGGLVAVAALIAWVVLHRMRPTLMLRTLYAFVAIVTVGVASGILDRWITPTKTVRDRGDLNGRLTLWPYARHIIEEHLFFGTGQGTFRVENPFALVAHNAILEVGTGLGLVGVAIFIGTIYSAVVADSRAITDARLRALLVGSFLCVSTPIFLSGHWDQSAAVWVAIGLFSRAGAISRPTEQPAHRELDLAQAKGSYHTVAPSSAHSVRR